MSEIRNFRLPGWLAIFVMNHHLHRTHHCRPNLPCCALPQEFRDTDERYDAGYAAGILRQFRGPVWVAP